MLKFIDFSRQIYKVVSLKRKNIIIEMNKEQVGSSAVGCDSIIMLIACFILIGEAHPAHLILCVFA